MYNNVLNKKIKIILNIYKLIKYIKYDKLIIFSKKI